MRQSSKISLFGVLTVSLKVALTPPPRVAYISMLLRGDNHPEIFEGQWKWYHSIDGIRVPIRLPL